MCLVRIRTCNIINSTPFLFFLSFYFLFRIISSYAYIYAYLTSKNAYINLKKCLSHFEKMLLENWKNGSTWKAMFFSSQVWFSFTYKYYIYPFKWDIFIISMILSLLIVFFLIESTMRYSAFPNLCTCDSLIIMGVRHFVKSINTFKRVCLFFCPCIALLLI